MIFLLTLLFSSLAFGGSTPFQIINRTSDLPTSNEVFQALNTSANSLETSLNSGFLSETSRRNFDNAMAIASTSMNSSIVTDHGVNYGTFILGSGVQGAAYLNGKSASSISAKADSSLPSIGADASTNFLLAARASNIGLFKNGKIRGERLMLYLSGGYLGTSTSGVTFQIMNFGLNGNYKIVMPKGLPYLFQWGGLNFGSGINYSLNSINYSASLSQSSKTTVSGQTATVSTNLNYTLGVKANNFLIPFELSTSLRFLYLFTLYMGGGIDFNLGSSGLTGSASGPVTATYTGTTAASNLFSGTASLNLDDGVIGKPSLAVLRGFGGLQFNLTILKIGGEFVVLSNGSMGGAVILRIAV